MGDLISVVIPVYKVEKYIEKCLDSVLKQTYPNLEIIVVDDGSPDNCGKLCDEYAKKDERITVIHKENGGLSDARNCGLRCASGTYITFLDSDDYLADDFIQVVYESMLENAADLVAVSLQSIDESGNKIGREHSGAIKALTDSEAMVDMFKSNGIPWCAQAKLYKRSMFDGIEYPVGKLMEDKGTTYKLFARCKKIIYMDVPKYIYLVRQGSIMRGAFNEKRLQLDIQFELNDFIEKHYHNAINIAHAHTVKCIVSSLAIMSYNEYHNGEIEKKYFEIIQKYKKEFYKEKSMDRRFKLLCRFMILSRTFSRENFYKNKLYKLVCGKAGLILSTK